MKFKKLILFITFISLLLGENKRLSFDDVQGKSPFESTSAFLQSIMPAPVFSRRVFTNFASIPIRSILPLLLHLLQYLQLVLFLYFLHYLFGM